MIITLIGIFVLIFGISCFIVSTCIDTRPIYNLSHEKFRLICKLDHIGGYATLSGFIFSFFCIVIIIGNHIGTDMMLESQEMEYNALCMEYEAIKDNIELSDKTVVAYAQIINDITEWNKDTIKLQYWSNNLFTNWFHNKKLTNSRKLIEIE